MIIYTSIPFIPRTGVLFIRDDKSETTWIKGRGGGILETVSPEGTFCDTVQVPSGAGDMQLI